MTVNRRTLARLLGPPPYLNESLSRAGEIGVANGLAWTESGGEVLTLEATMTPGKRFCQPHADAINPPFTSCLQPMTRSPSLWPPAKSWIIGPATTPKSVSIPESFSWRAASTPPWRTALLEVA